MAEKNKLKNFFSLVLRFGVSGLLLWWIFSKIDMESTVEALRTADLKYIALAGVIFFGLNFILLYRWLIFIRALDVSVTTLNVTRYFFMGLFGNLFLPSAIGGDIIKIVGLCKNSSQKPRVVASVLIDRLSGFAGIALLAICSFVFGYGMIDDKSLAIPVVLMAVGSVTVAGMLFHEGIYSFFCKVFNRLPKVKDKLMEMHYDIAMLKDKKSDGIKAIILSSVSQSVLAVTFFLVAKGLHQDIPMVYFLIFVPIICIASSFPSIGGLGVREAGAAYLFGKIGIESGIAVSMTLINFLFMVLVGLMGGIIYVVTISSGRVQHPPSDAANDSKGD